MTIEEFLKDLKEQEEKPTVICIDLWEFKSKVKYKFKNKLSNIKTKDVVAATSLIIFQYSLYLLCTTNNPLKQGFTNLLERLKNIDLHHLSLDELKTVFNDDKINKEYQQFKLQEQKEFKQYELEEKRMYNEYVKGEINAAKDVKEIKDRPLIPTDNEQAQKFLKDLQDKQLEFKNGFDPMKWTEDTFLKFGKAFAKGLWDATFGMLKVGILLFIYNSVDLITGVSFYLCLFLCLASFFAYVLTNAENAKGIMAKSCIYYFMLAILKYVTVRTIDIEELNKQYKYGR